MSKIVFAVAAICLAQIVVGRQIREAPAETDAWTAMVNAANETFNALNSALLKINNVGSNDELVSKVQNDFKTLGNDVQTGVARLTEEAKPLTGKAQELLTAFTDKASELATEFKAEHPDLIPSDPKKLQENVEKRIREVANQTEELRANLRAEGAVVSDKIEAVLKTILENTQTAAQNVKNQIETAVSSSTKQ